jgi:ubiquinone/menaquinone biosynthesis C-methylase UbiE
MKLNLGCGDDRLEGFVNLDMRHERSDFLWRFETGLPYPNNSVEGITTSHAINALPLYLWTRVFLDCFRVLVPGGVFRLTDDDNESPSSRYYLNPWHGSAAMTGPVVFAAFLRRAGFTPYSVTPSTTKFKDDSLIRALRETSPPYTFHIEGVK